MRIWSARFVDLNVDIYQSCALEIGREDLLFTSCTYRLLVEFIVLLLLSYGSLVLCLLFLATLESLFVSGRVLNFEVLASFYDFFVGLLRRHDGGIDLDDRKDRGWNVVRVSSWLQSVERKSQNELVVRAARR
jgi:hypothetical protein